jgi:hypothetical protein
MAAAHAPEKDAPAGEDVSIRITSRAVTALLQEQYQCTEAYCNASTTLFQLVQSPSPRDHVLWTCISRHQGALSRLQYIMHQLEKMVEMLEERNSESIGEEDASLFMRLWNGSVVLREHLECTRRILGTLYGSCAGMSFDRYGLPKMQHSSQGGIHVQLVGLATLRASIEKVNESLPR